MNILIIEPYFAGSHKAWAQGYQRHSKHRVEILSLSGHHWKWRMHGGAVTLARKFLTDRLKPDIIVATDMLDVSTFLALTRSQTASIPIYLYFHENQITYPRTTYDKDVKKDRDHHYGWINFVSALSANRVYFNSRFHLETFYKALPTFLNQFPDKKEKGQIEELEKKSKVLLLGMDFTPFLASFPPSVVSDNSPLILWNHRWEYDKGPEVFFRVLWQLKTQHYSFRLAVLGESYSQQPPVFAQAQKLFKQEIIHWGYIESEAEYAKLLFEADVLPVTSLQDFFGMSVVEAMYANCIPLVPTGKVYEEHIPP
ncbi:MAG: DUF3524 domain-containing protein, partial [Bacteroidota bacterium]